MSFFPGEIIETFVTKKGKQAVIRFPKWEDLDQMILFINKISEENTYTTFSGETIYKDGEMYYLSEMFKSMERKDGIYLACFVNETIVGSATIIRDIAQRKRSSHIGIFGITIAHDFRNEGIGEKLSEDIINLSKTRIENLRLITLNVYSPNIIAQKLYTKLGFREYGRLQEGIGYADNYIDEIKMVKKI